MNTLKKSLKKHKDLIDKALDRLLPKVTIRPKTLHRAMRYSIFSGGKRIRPILTLQVYKLFGKPLKDIIKAACAVEMVHTYSLIHDDLPSMDNDDYRRGNLSCHKKFGEATAILAGDALLTRAFQVLGECKRVNRIQRAITELSKSIGSQGMVGGQEMDLREKETLNKDTLNFIIKNKTASLFGASVMLGAIFGKADKRQEKALYNFGKFLGIAFQLMDDSFDNDGYMRIIGTKKTKALALEFIRKAKTQLCLFGRSADRLKKIADFVVERKE